MSDLHVIYRDDEVIVSVEGVPYVVSAFDEVYEDVCEAISCRDVDALLELLSASEKMSKLNKELEQYGLVSEGDDYYYNGNLLPIDLADYLYDAIDRGSALPIVKFIQRLFENPNHDTRMRLFTFLQKGKLPINENGHILAYKVVTGSYLDKRTKSINNTPGTIVPRFTWSQVDTNNSVTCSRGYHVCSLDYLIGGGFYSEGDRVVSASFDPADVAAIPPDYNDSKLRCLQYKVIADITDQFVKERKKTRLNAGVGGLSPLSERTGWSLARDYY